jgi:hypothetical protein
MVTLLQDLCHFFIRLAGQLMLDVDLICSREPILILGTRRIQITSTVFDVLLANFREMDPRNTYLDLPSFNGTDRLILTRAKKSTISRRWINIRKSNRASARNSCEEAHAYTSRIRTFGRLCKWNAVGFGDMSREAFPTESSRIEC